MSDRWRDSYDQWKLASPDDDAYALDDPKHPTWADRQAERWDNRDKFACPPDAVDESAGMSDA